MPPPLPLVLPRGDTWYCRDENPRRQSGLASRPKNVPPPAVHFAKGARHFSREEGEKDRFALNAGATVFFRVREANGRECVVLPSSVSVRCSLCWYASYFLQCVGRDLAPRLLDDGNDSFFLLCFYPAQFAASCWSTDKVLPFRVRVFFQFFDTSETLSLQVFSHEMYACVHVCFSFGRKGK